MLFRCGFLDFYIKQGQILTEHPEATREYIASQTQKNINTIKTHFKWLILSGYVKRIGPDKGGYWEVNPLRGKDILDECFY